MPADEIHLRTGEYLLREGEESSQMYYIQSGSLAVFKVKGGAEQQIGTLYKGELVGEMSFLDKEPRSASIKAIGDCTLTVIPSEKFERFLDKQPNWFRALIFTLLDRLRRANARIHV